MRHLLLTLLLLTLCATSGMAQINLREGIVITLSGDTLHGSIDYRTDRMNMVQCYFIPDGKTEAIRYGAKDIAGYRFLDNGRYYVSKSIPDESTKRDTTLFLEYVVRGQMNLYFHFLPDSLKSNVFYFENEEGKLVRFQTVKLGEKSAERRKRLKEVMYITSNSPSTQELLWDKCHDLKDVKNTILHYNKEVCPDGECEVFEYKAKKTPKADRIIYPFVKAEYDFYYLSNLFGNDPSVTTTTSGFGILAGADFYLSRLSKGLFTEAEVAYHHFHFEKKGYYSQEWWNDVEFKVAVGYQWKNFQFQPRVYGGYSINIPRVHSTSSEETPAGFEGKKEETSYHGRGEFVSRGFYGGIGLAYPLKKGALLLNGEYHHTRTTTPVYRGVYIGKIQIHRFSLSLGYQF